MNELSRIDLNLVPLLDALLEECNVSRAAARVQISQPAASKALARLRRHFDDELLVRSGKGYVLTPLGQQLAPLAASAARANRSVVRSSAAFDEGASERTFTIAASEYGQLVIGPAIVEEVHRHAPRSGVQFVSPFIFRADSDSDVLARVDGWLSPKEVMNGPPSLGDLRDEWVLVADQHVGLPGELAHLNHRQWVVPTVRGNQMELQLGVLRANGLQPQVAVATESFAAIPFLVSGTDRIGLVQGAIARKLATAAGVHIAAFPYPVPPLHLTMWWAQDRSSDAAHEWFRARVLAAMSRQA